MINLSLGEGSERGRRGPTMSFSRPIAILSTPARARDPAAADRTMLDLPEDTTTSLGTRPGKISIVIWVYHRRREGMTR